MSDPFDYLFLEPLLIERIRSEVPGLAIVSGVSDLAALSEQDQPAPSVYVVYLGDEIGTGADHQGGRRAIQAIGQQWAVVLVVHYADSSNSGEGARRGGQDLGRLVKALTGWAPPSMWRR
ncbi:phage tail terminator protein [Pseudomonas aeruginosa]|uniref:phage tail terminator protein n=1 Tax=Pseudomonas aeruginosa TaxID=287 RepID=UPI003D6EAECA